MAAPLIMIVDAAGSGELYEVARQHPVLGNVPIIVVGEEAMRRTVGELIGKSLPSTVDTIEWLAHDLKSPLGVAMMNTDVMMLRERDELDRTCLTSLQRQLARMDELVRSLLDASKLDAGAIVLERESINMATWAQAIVEDWRSMHPQFEFELRLSESPLESHIDAKRIRQVLDNLISNAVNYGGTDQRVVIELGHTEQEIEIRVQDFGIGIGETELPRIFQRFHRASDDRRGHGLGLYIAAELARLHDGSIRVESKVGHGSTFVLALPRT